MLRTLQWLHKVLKGRCCSGSTFVLATFLTTPAFPVFPPVMLHWCADPQNEPQFLLPWAFAYAISSTWTLLIYPLLLLPFFFFFRTTPSNHSGLSSAMTLSSGLSWLLQMGSSLSHHCFLTQNVSACWPQAFPFSTLDWKLILKGQDCGGFWLLCSQSLAHAWYIEKLNNCLLNKWIVGRGKDYITREEQKS